MIILEGDEKRFAGILAKPAKHLRDLYNTYGPIVQISKGKFNSLFVFGSRYNKTVLCNPDLFQTTEVGNLPFRCPLNSSLGRLTRGLLTMNHMKHREQREFIVSAFNKQQLSFFRESIVCITQQHLARWRVGQQRELLIEMKRLSLKISFQILFGLNPARDGRRLYKLLERFTHLLFSVNRFCTPARDSLATPPQLLKTSDELEQELNRLFARCRSSDDHSVLATLLRKHQESPHLLSPVEVAAQIVTLYIAGFESTSSAFTWALFLLLQHPAVLKDVVVELDQQLAGQPPGVDDFDQLQRLKNVIKESLRLFPPALWGLRVCHSWAQIDQHRVPPQTLVVFSPFITHRMPAIFPAPDRFQPDRWHTREYSNYEYLPFGAGPHRCVGAALVMLKMQIVLALLLQRYRLSLVSNVIDRGNFKNTRRALRVSIHPQDYNFSKTAISGNVCELVQLDE